MTEQSIKKVIGAMKEFCEQSDGYYRFYSGYSGRFMYGRRCAGIVTDASEAETVIDLLDYFDEVGVKGAKTVIKKPASDNMALSMIYYWPELVM